MYSALLTHKVYISNRLTKGLSTPEREQLLQCHLERVRDFQHERLVHLLVTFFFGLLLLVSLCALLTLQLSELELPLIILTSILFILELAYVWHYYQLENGVQSLYALTEELGKK